MKIKKSSELSPIFITGVWRSGTTLVSRILNNHRDLHITYDTVHFMRFSYNKYDPITEMHNKKELLNEINKRLKLRYEIGIPVRQILNEQKNSMTYSSLYDAIMTKFLLGNNSGIWGEKTNLSWSKIPDFLKMFPNGRVLHIIRDPRAVLASWKNFTNAPGNDYLDSIFNSYDSMSNAIQYARKYQKKRFIYITYENLVNYPVKTIQSVCKKFEIEYQDSMLNYSDFTDRHGNNWEANTVYNEKITGISSRLMNKWTSELEKWEIYLTDKLTGELYRKFGYKQKKIKTNDELINAAINKIAESKLTSDGFIRLMLTNKGVERYPTDPLDKKNWNTIKNIRKNKVGRN